MTITIDVTGIHARWDTMNSHLALIATACGTTSSGMMQAADKITAACTGPSGILYMLGTSISVKGLTVDITTGAGTISNWLDSIDKTLGVTNERLQSVGADLQAIQADTESTSTSMGAISTAAGLVDPALGDIETTIISVADRIAPKGGTLSGLLDSSIDVHAIAMGVSSGDIVEAIEAQTTADGLNLDSIGIYLSENVGDRISSAGHDNIAALITSTGAQATLDSNLIADRIATGDDSISGVLSSSAEDVSEQLTAIVSEIAPEEGRTLTGALQQLALSGIAIDSTASAQSQLVVTRLGDISTGISGTIGSLCVNAKGILDEMKLETTAMTTGNNELHNLRNGVTWALSETTSTDQHGDLLSAVGHGVQLNRLVTDMEKDIKDYEKELNSWNNQVQDIELTGPTGNILRIHNQGPPFPSY